jgi:penicillin V acylase-like amidase (Ntn superfamily)
MNRALLMLPVLFSFLSGIGESCTPFCITEADRVIFAKNYDWNIGYGLILINKRGVAKKSASGQPENRGSWVSRYGSLTFNQYGREFPSGGINEAGLAVELMWLDDAEYPADPCIPSVGTLEWIQYQLDQHATVKDVVASAFRVRIASEVKLHYLVADRSGNTANIEVLEWKACFA